jgi:hypothetical protein
MYIDNALLGLVSEETPGEFVLELPSAEFADREVARIAALADVQRAIEIAVRRLRGEEL